MDLRERVMRDIDAGMRRCDVAAKYSVSKDWISKLKRLRRERGTFAPIQQKYHTSSKLDDQLDELQQTVRRRPDATLKELQEMLGTTASVAAVHRALRKLKMTFKKKFSCPPNNNDRWYKNNVASGASGN
jgi:transposase